MSGTFFVVATPIGNLSDITLRGLETLKSVELIACEDTRQTLKLLNHFEIKNHLVSYHQHSRISRIEEIVSSLVSGKNVAMVTDAGTPGISDPGNLLVAAVREKGINIEVIPGPSAVTAAISMSGFESKEFVFYGFLPLKKGRQKKLKAISEEQRAVIIYESPYRIKKLFREILEFVGDREIFVARELTKKFEDTYSGKVSEVLDAVIEKGEFVVIIKEAR